MAKIIPDEFIPEVGSSTVVIDGNDYLVRNDAMYTFYKRSMGEFSEFFLALRDRKKILGCKCSVCGIVRVPPFLTRCPDCDFAETTVVEMGDVGTMLHTPPITYFANALFQKQVPYGRGRLMLKGADTAMSVNCYSTKGILVPGLIKKGTEMKIVFRDERNGEISDFFCVPTSELTPEQIAKPGLQESELDWEHSIEPALPQAGAADTAAFEAASSELASVVGQLNGCARAKKDIAEWHRLIRVKATGGSLLLKIADGNLSVEKDSDAPVDLVMVCPDLSVLVSGLAYKGSLTQAIMDSKLWLSKNVEFNTVFKLERMARSLARTMK